jgi:hypothetical protein
MLWTFNSVRLVDYEGSSDDKHYHLVSALSTRVLLNCRSRYATLHDYVVFTTLLRPLPKCHSYLIFSTGTKLHMAFLKSLFLGFSMQILYGSEDRVESQISIAHRSF